MPDDPDVPPDAPLAAWRSLTRLGRAASRQVDAALKAENLPADEIHALLAALEGADPPGNLTARALEQALDLPQYAVSRLLDRAERIGVIARRPHPSDRRSRLVIATSEGRGLLPRLARTRQKALGDLIAARLRPGQLRRLNDLLAKLEDDTPPG